MQEVVERLSDKFASYNQESLITKLGALALFPENHSKKSRLRAALQAAIFTKNKIEQQNFITDKVLANLLEQHFTSEEQIWQYEDPQEVMFTDIIQFHGGNFIIFPEVLADSHNALKLLLETIFMEGTKFPKSFKQEIYYAVSTLLNISNVIANKMEYKRYQNSPDSHHKLVFFPETYLMRRASNAIQFSYELIVA